MTTAPEPPKASYAELLPAYRPLLKYVRPDLTLVLLDYVAIMVAVVTNTAMIWLIGQPFNLLQQQQYDAVLTSLALFAAVVVINQISQLMGGMLTNTIAFRTIGRLRNAIMRQALHLCFPVISTMERGDLLARLSMDVDRIKGVIVDALLMVGSHVLTFSIYVFMLFWIDSALALWALLIAPLFIVHQRLFAPHKRRATERFYEFNGRLLGFEEQALAHTRGINHYTAEHQVGALHQGVFEKARYWATRDRNIDVWYGNTFAFLIYVSGLVIVLLGIEGIKEQRFGIGHLVSFMLYLGYLTVPSRGLADILFQSFGALGASARVRELFHAQPLTRDHEGAPPLQIRQGAIECRDLAFAYHDKSMLYAGLDISIAGGETVALVGPSGAGKTTLANLLDRYYEPVRGMILIDGQDIAGVSLASLRRNITIVSQEPFLFNDTIRANLLMVQPEADHARLLACCRDSFAQEFIDKLPQGLDTVIGSGGVELSTGQKQRLSLAQAFLRHTPILIMDEATSALDSHSEQQVIEAMQRLRKGRTTLLIAHRYSSLQSAHRILYFNGDGTVSLGRHEELMHNHAGYQQAVAWQTRKKGDK